MATIQDYQPQWAAAFKALNLAWLERYFHPEPYDLEVLSDPEQYILRDGGAIYFVIEEEQPVGTAAIMYNDKGELELTKMAVASEAQGRGFASQLMQHCIDAARARKAKELILYSNTLLKPAIHLYRKFGFQEMEVCGSEYARCNIKMYLPLES